MNAEQQAVQDIVENLRAVKGEDFARAVLAATQASNLISMIGSYDPEQEDAREVMREVACGTIASLLATITAALNLDPREITEWADRITGRLAPTQH